MAKQQSPLVSIVIPVFNSERFLGDAIESALGQTWSNCELIIVDDHSCDDSWNIANSFTKNRVIVVKNQRRGAAAARNLGMQLSRGDYLQFLDADDLLASEKIEFQVRALSDSSAGAVAMCAWGRFNKDPREARFVEEPVWQDYPYPWKWLVDSWEGGGMMQTACWLVPRELALEAGPWNESLVSNPNDDGEYFCRVLLKSVSVIYCPVKGVFYRSSMAGSLSRRADDQAVESAYKTCELYEQHVENSCLGAHFRHALRKNYLNFIYQYHPSRKDLMKRAWLDAVRLGGPDNEPVGGKFFQRIADQIGFMNALRFRALIWKAGIRRRSTQSS